MSVAVSTSLHRRGLSQRRRSALQLFTLGDLPRLAEDARRAWQRLRERESTRGAEPRR